MASKSIKGITIELDGNATKLVDSLKDVEKKSNAVNSELRQVNKLIKFNPNNTETLAQKQKLLKDQVQATSDKLKTLKDAQKQVNEQFKNGEISEEAYRGFQRELIETESKLKHYEKSLKDATSTYKKFQDATKATGDKLQKIGDGVKSAGTKMSVGVTAPLVAIGAASHMAFQEVDSAMDTIITKTGATGDSLGEFEQIFRNMSGTIPVDMQKIGDAIGEVNTQFGLTGDKLENASNYMIKFAEINGTDITNATIKSKQAIEAYGLSADDLNSVLDVTTKVAQNTGQSVDSLMDKAVAGAPQIKALGLSFDEGITLMGQFEQAGVDSSAALSSMSKASVIYAKDGKTLEEGLSGTIDAIKNASSETEAMTLAAEVFGTKGAPRMIDAIKRGAFSMEGLADTAKNASGTVGETFEATLDPADQMMNAMNELKEVGSDLSLAMQEVLAPMLEKVIEVIKKVSEWFNSLSDDQKQTIVIIGMVAAAIGPLLVILGTLISSVGAVVGAIAAISAPVLIVIGVIAAMIAIGVALWKNWDTIKIKAGELWTSIKTTFDNIKNSISNSINAAKDAVKAAIDKMKSFFNFTWSLPKIKLPRFSISGKFSLNPPSVPKFGIEWYKKGGILTKPTAFGMNGNNLMVGGEAGKEAVLPLNEKNLAMIGAGIAKALGSQQQTPQKTGDIVINIDGAEFMRVINPHFESQGGENYRMTKRGLAW